MSDGSEQAPQESGLVSLGRLFPWEGQVAGSLEEAGVGQGQVGGEGGGRQAGQSLPPLSWLPPTSLGLSRDPSTGLGVSKACANVKQKLKG